MVRLVRISEDTEHCESGPTRRDSGRKWLGGAAESGEHASRSRQPPANAIAGDVEHRRHGIVSRTDGRLDRRRSVLSARRGGRIEVTFINRRYVYFWTVAAPTLDET